jgi:thiamine transporter ThiT
VLFRSGVTVGAIRGFLRGLVELAFCEKEAFCAFEILFTTSAAFCAAFYACHGFFSLSLGDKQDAFTRRKTRSAAGLSLIVLLTAFVCLATNFLAAYRPAGTREALPGAMSRIEERNSKLEDR